MPAAAKKFPDLEAFNQQANVNGLLDILHNLGGPISDASFEQIVSDGNWTIVKNIDDLSAGDLARCGNRMGIVTAILDDGGGPAVNNRIEVTWNTPYIQNPGVSPTDLVRTYNVVSNTNADADGSERLEVINALDGLGAVFLKRAA